MPRSLDVLLTALAPTVWGSTYIVTTELRKKVIRSLPPCSERCLPVSCCS